MKKSLGVIVIIFIISFPAAIYSQGEYTGFDEVYLLSPANDYYANNYLNGLASGKGNAGIASLSNGIGAIYLNPASRNIEKKFSINVQFSFKRSHSTDYGDELQPILPSGYAAACYKISKNLQTGFIYNNPTSATIYMAKMGSTGNTPTWSY